MKTYKVSVMIVKKWLPKFLYRRRWLVLVDAETAYKAVKKVGERQLLKYEVILFIDITVVEEVADPLVWRSKTK